MYELKVCNDGQDRPVEVVRVETATGVLSAIASLLTDHPACFRIHVYAGHARLFSVDCEGKTAHD